ncbi:alpha/beta fold hydrolase [Hasllibacter sp. MH4015]|uniref:alpha/beta fold hydrolase n=1 Tax=Hasllibacter sp. MH4015 TaxID=2854029 RepID=UPI001CD4B824|nr:alpha/beta fold hydrolase [Hasllibacter sp. MH4015]
MSTILHLSERKVACHVAGRGAPLVLIHGVGLNAAAWAPQVEVLSRTHRVFALDMPGHGGSDPLPRGAELPDFVAWCADAIAALDVGPVSLAGHSMGALIAAGVAVTRPERVARLALLNPVHRRPPAARDAVEARAKRIAAGEVDAQAPLDRWFTEDQATPRAQVAKWLSAVDRDGYATAYAAFARGDATYADDLPDIACPVLVLTGADDPNSTPAMARAMAAAAQDGEAIIIPGHRHMVNLTAPAAVTAHLAHWLSRDPTANPRKREA